MEAAGGGLLSRAWACSPLIIPVREAAMPRDIQITGSDQRQAVAANFPGRATGLPRARCRRPAQGWTFKAEDASHGIRSRLPLP